MEVGRIVRLKGYITQLHFIRSRSAERLDRLIGYRAGRMGQGWALLYLIEMPRPDDFEFRGYSHMSGGAAAGDRRTAEQRLVDEGKDVRMLKQGIIATKFRTIGPTRLAKVLPNAPAFGERDYPPGAGIPQWELRRELPFRVAELIGGRQAAEVH